MDLIAQLLFESRIGAYIEWLANDVIMIANKIEYKDTYLVMLPADAIAHKPNSLAYPWSLLFYSYRVSLAEYN